MTGAELKDLLSGCYGSENYYRVNPISRMLITDGVKLMVDNAEAHWLVSDISIMYKFKKTLVGKSFLGVVLDVKGDKGLLTFDDGNGNVLYEKKYKTDFPEGKWEMFLIDDVLLLTSEY